MVCEICGKNVPNQNLKRHILSHKKEVPCLMCGKIVKSGNKFCSHSCSAKFNNSGVARNWNGPKYCKKCKAEIKGQNKLFCSNECKKSFRLESNILKMKGMIDIPPSSVRKTIMAIREHKCNICGLTSWNGVDIPLVVDHINGNSSDNTVENLRLICPNCDAQTPTYKSKNRGSGRHYRRERYKLGKSY